MPGSASSLLIILSLVALIGGCTISDQSPITVDEPSVKLEAELNLHYKTFSDVNLSDKYLERWLYKYNYLPAADVMSDKRLFSCLDARTPDLARARAFFQKADLQSARASIVSHFRHRAKPCFIDLGTLSPESKSRVLETVDIALSDPRFPDIPWLREEYGHGSKDARWNWVSYLYNAYRYTNDLKYLEGTMRMFSFWYETVRPPAGTPKIWLSPSFIDNPWCSHLASYRLHTLAALDGMLAEKDLDEISLDLRIPLYKSVLEHARFIIAVNPGFRSGNIQICHTLNLLEAGIYFPEFLEARDWIGFAWQNLLKHAWLDILPDGGHFERATSYNIAVIRFWRRILELSLVAGLETPDWLVPKLKKAQKWTVDVYTPILNLAPIGDSGMGSENYALPHLIDGALLYPCPEFKFFVKDHPDMLSRRADELFGDDGVSVINKLNAMAAEEPAYTSLLLPDTGWAVMRSGWDRNALYLLFDFGSNEPWHCHRDGLGFSIFAYGKPLVTDCGHAGGYDSDRSKQWYKETRSHNLVSINGMSQRKMTAGTCRRWVSTASADFIDAEHDGYKYLGAYCRRKITFVKPHYWIITDNITEKMCQTSGYHECEWLAHFQPTRLSVCDKTGRVHTNNAGANILLIPSRHESLDVIQDKGWMVTPSGEVDDAPYIAFARESDPPIDFEVVLYPYEGAGIPDVKVERINSGKDGWRCRSLTITTPHGTDYYLEKLEADYYLVIDEKSPFHRYGEFSFDGEMALIRQKNGELISILLVGGSCLRRGGEEMIRCTGKLDWAEILFPDKSVNGEFNGRIVVSGTW